MLSFSGARRPCILASSMAVTAARATGGRRRGADRPGKSCDRMPKVQFSPTCVARRLTLEAIPCSCVPLVYHTNPKYESWQRVGVGQKEDGVDLVIVPRRLSVAAFQPFGEVIEHTGNARRHVIASAFETDGSAPERLLWVSRIANPGRLPLQVTTMERHPHSAQFFSPLFCSGFLIAVCPSRDDGSPDIGALSAFVARSGQGVVYGRNVWHHPMVALGGPANFAVSMAKGCVDDDVVAVIDRRVTIVDMPSVALEEDA